MLTRKNCACVGILNIFKYSQERLMTYEEQTIKFLDL